MNEEETLEQELAKKLCQMRAERDQLLEAATILYGAASRLALASPSSGPLWHGSQEIQELQEALRKAKQLATQIQECSINLDNVYLYADKIKAPKEAEG